MADEGKYICSLLKYFISVEAVKQAVIEMPRKRSNTWHKDRLKGDFFSTFNLGHIPAIKFLLDRYFRQPRGAAF